MLKKILFTLALLSMLCISAEPGPDYKWLVKFAVKNKSGMPIEISLQTSDQENIYYLRLPVGDMVNPVRKTYTIVPAVYTATLYYVELWDPVYGYSCSSKSQSIDAHHWVQITVLPCNKIIANPGKYPWLKFGASSGGRRTK